MDRLFRAPFNNQWVPSIAETSHNAPRSYIVKTGTGTELRRYRRDLLHTNEQFVYAPHRDDKVTGQTAIRSP